MAGKIEKLAQNIVIASNDMISYDDARQRAKTYYKLKRKHPFKFVGEHLNIENIAKNMVNGMLPWQADDFPSPEELSKMPQFYDEPSE